MPLSTCPNLCSVFMQFEHVREFVLAERLNIQNKNSWELRWVIAVALFCLVLAKVKQAAAQYNVYGLRRPALLQLDKASRIHQPHTMIHSPQLPMKSCKRIFSFLMY